MRGLCQYSSLVVLFRTTVRRTLGVLTCFSFFLGGLSVLNDYVSDLEKNSPWSSHPCLITTTLFEADMFIEWC